MNQDLTELPYDFESHWISAVLEKNTFIRMINYCVVIQNNYSLIRRQLTKYLGQLDNG